MSMFQIIAEEHDAFLEPTGRQMPPATVFYLYDWSRFHLIEFAPDAFRPQHARRCRHVYAIELPPAGMRRHFINIEMSISIYSRRPFRLSYEQPRQHNGLKLFDIIGYAIQCYRQYRCPLAGCRQSIIAGAINAQIIILIFNAGPAKACHCWPLSLYIQLHSLPFSLKACCCFCVG